MQGHCVVPYRTAHFDLLETVKGHNVFESFEQQSWVAAMTHSTISPLQTCGLLWSFSDGGTGVIAIPHNVLLTAMYARHYMCTYVWACGWMGRKMEEADFFAFDSKGEKRTTSVADR